MGTLSTLRMLLRVLVLATLVVFSFAKEKTIQRQKKLFSLFSVVTFPNNQCTGSSSSSSQEVLGTCYAETECASKGGTVDGNCAARSWSLIVVQPWTITVPTFKTHHIQQRIQLQ